MKRPLVAALSLLLSGAFLIATSTARTTGVADDGCDSGLGLGHVNLPENHHGGRLVGELLTQHDEFVYEVVAHLTGRDSADADHERTGFMFGRLHSTAPDHVDAPNYFVFGRWAAGPKGAGVFEAHVLRFDDLHVPYIVGWMDGAFHDPPGDEVGSFEAEWEICH
jgi:hypothetical protein